MAREQGKPIRRLLAGLAAAPRRRPRGAAPRIDALEGRVVLSQLGLRGHGPAAHVGPTSPSGGTTTTTTGTRSGPRGGGADGGGVARNSQLNTDLQTLQTDLRAAIGGSSVTDAQRLALAVDLQTLAQAGVTIDRAALAKVADSLLTALADGSYDGNADTAASIRSAFNAAFAGTTDATQLDRAFTDFVAVARNLNLSTDTLKTLADDRAAIRTDLGNHGIGNVDHPGPGASNLDLILAPGVGGLGLGHRGHGPGDAGGFGLGGGPGSHGHRGGRF